MILLQKSKLHLFCVIMVFGTGVARGGANLICNSSFELDAAGWMNRPIVTGDAVNGQKYMQLAVPQPYCKFPLLLSRFFQIKPGSRYTLSGYFRSPDSTGRRVQFQLVKAVFDKYASTSPADAVVLSKTITLGEKWKREQISGILPAVPESNDSYYILVKPIPSDQKQQAKIFTMDIDALQLEEGSLTKYSPSAEIEYAFYLPILDGQIFTAMGQFYKGQLHYINQSLKIKFIAYRYNNIGKLTKKINISIKDFWDNETYSKKTSILWPSSENKASYEFEVPLKQVGIFRIETDTSAIPGIFGVITPWASLKSKSHFGNAVYNFNEPSELSQITAKITGVGMLRLHCYTRCTDWAAVEPQPGKWSFWENAASTKKRLNIDVLGMLGEPPAWAINSAAPLWIKNLEQFRAYCYKTVKHHKADISYWEIFNEPYGWCSGKNYATLLRTAFEAAKEANPNCKIVGICGGDWKLSFVEEALKSGAAKYMDILSYHQYFTSDIDKIEENTFTTVQAIRQLLDSNGGRHIPIWNTESGCWSQDFYKNTQFNQFGNSGPDGANWVVRTHVCSFAAGVKKYFYFLTVPCFYSTQQPNLTMLDFVGGPRPILLAYAAMIRLIDDKEFTGKFKLDNGQISAYLFANKKEQVLVYWGNKFKDKIGYLNTSILAADAKVYDVMGAPLTPNSTQWKLPVRREPYYIVFSPQASRLKIKQSLSQPITITSDELDGLKREFASDILKNAVLQGNAAIHPLIDAYKFFITQNSTSGMILINHGTKSLLIKCKTGLNSELFWQTAGRNEVFRANSYTLRPGEKIAVYGKFPVKEIGSLVFCDDVVIEHDARLYSSNHKTPGLAVKLSNFANKSTDATLQIGSISEKIGLDSQKITTSLSSGEIKTLFVPFTAYPDSGKDEKNVIDYQILADAMKIDAKLSFKTECAYFVDNAPVIDGDLSEWSDSGYITISKANQIVAQKNPKDLWKGMNDASARVRIRWNDEFVFFAIEVQDDNVIDSYGYDGDGIELFFDNDLLLRPWDNKYSFDNQQIFINPQKAQKTPIISEATTPLPPEGDLYKDKIKIVAAEKIVPNGYILELAIPAKKLRQLNLQEGNMIGFDIAINDGDGGGGRKCQLCWAGTADNYKNPRNFGILIFLPKLSGNIQNCQERQVENEK